MDDQRFAWSESAPFRVVADAVPQMMWSARADGWIDWYNARWYDYTAQTPDEAAGWGWQAVHHPEDLPKVLLAWPRSIATGEPFEMEFRLRGADGQYRWFLTRATPLRGDDGRVARWFGTNTDIEGARSARVREGFFSQLGAELAGALSLDQTLRVITRRIVPDFADWAMVNLIDERGEIRLASAYHRDAAARAVLERLRGTPSAKPNAHGGTAEVLRTGRPVVYETLTEEYGRRGMDTPFREAFAEIGYDSALIVPLLSGGRIVGTLNAVLCGSARAYSRADVPFFEELGRRIAPAIGNATAYERERRVATTFQEAALVSALPDVPGLAFDAIYQAAMLEATVGGDWYDVFRLPDGRLVLSVGDVAGKGLEAAVAMASVRQSIRTAALINPEPVAVLNAVDRIVRAMARSPFVTAFVGVLDPVSFEFTFASAGHPPPLLRGPDRAVRELFAPDLPLGIRGHAEGAATTIDIAPGSVLLCYTDGLTEFDRDPLRGEAIVSEALANTDERIAHAIYARVSNGLPPHDDVAILAVSCDLPLTAIDGPRRASCWRFAVTDAEAAQRARREYVARLRAAGLGDADVFSAELVFGELLGNVVRYASGPIELTSTSRARRRCCTSPTKAAASSSGRGFRPTSSPSAGAACSSSPRSPRR